MKAVDPGVTTTQISSALGLKVQGLDLSQPLASDTVDQLKHWLADNCVLVFTKQSLTEEEQVRFGAYFGELKENLRKYAATDHPLVMYITNEVKDGQFQGALPDGEMYFHADMCYLEKPAMASILYGMSIPKSGGDTLFANMYRAYETLPDQLKQRIQGRKAINSYDPGKSDYASTRSRTSYQSVTEMSYSQPMVFRHPVNGRRALYVNRVMTREVEGLSEPESQELLDVLFQHQEQSEYIYRHQWQPGDVVMWDNRCTLHARTNFDASELRKLRRVTIKGDPINQ